MAYEQECQLKRSRLEGSGLDPGLGVGWGAILGMLGISGWAESVWL